MTTVAPGNTPLLVYRTGAAGIAEGVFLTVYTIGLFFYYAIPFLYTGDLGDYSTVFQVFYYWNALKPLLPLWALIYTTLQVAALAPVLVYMVFAGLMAVGSFGLLGALAAGLTACNTARGGAGRPCNDPLYCCVFWNDTAACSGLGPCNATGAVPDPPQQPSDLGADDMYLGLLWSSLVLAVLELVLVILPYLVYQRRFVKQRAAILLAQDAVLREYGPGSTQASVAGGPVQDAAATGEDDEFAVNSRIGGKVGGGAGVPAHPSDPPPPYGDARTYAARHQFYQRTFGLPSWQAHAHAGLDEVDAASSWAWQTLEEGMGPLGPESDGSWYGTATAADGVGVSAGDGKSQYPNARGQPPPPPQPQMESVQSVLGRLPSLPQMRQWFRPSNWSRWPARPRRPTSGLQSRPVRRDPYAYGYHRPEENHDNDHRSADSGPVGPARAAPATQARWSDQLVQRRPVSAQEEDDVASPASTQQPVQVSSRPDIANVADEAGAGTHSGPAAGPGAEEYAVGSEAGGPELMPQYHPYEGYSSVESQSPPPTPNPSRGPATNSNKPNKGMKNGHGGTTGASSLERSRNWATQRGDPHKRR